LLKSTLIDNEKGVLKMNKKGMRNTSRVALITDPPFTQALFGKTSWAWLWLILRLYVGWEWLQAGWAKVNNPAWVGPKAGSALSGFINGALAKTTGAHPDVQSWYAYFISNAVLPNARVWSYIVSFGETLVGIGLILGIFTGIAAFFGLFMNMNYLMAGAISTNPILLILSVFLVLAWKIAGWWGLDRWALVGLGTPWSPGLLFHNKESGEYEGKNIKPSSGEHQSVAG
jgi:thiosulfate dehydrogenase (quinone) large subunit